MTPRLFLVAVLCLGLGVWMGCAHSADTVQYTAGEHQVVVNDVRLYYRVAGRAEGSQPPVLYLHGGPGYNSYSFAVLAGSRLESIHRMIYLDQRGSGRSERPWDEQYSVEGLVEDVEALRRELGVPRLVLMGHSFGGTLALEYAARYPAHTAGLVLIGGFSDGPGSTAVWRRQLEAWHPQLPLAADSTAGVSDYDVVMQALAQIDGQDFFNRLQFQDQTYRVLQDSVDAASGLRNTGELSRALFANGLGQYRFEAHERVRAPVLVIAGRYDYAIGIETMRTLAEQLPRATYHEYARSAHFPYLEEADRFVQDIKAFLATLR